MSDVPDKKNLLKLARSLCKMLEDDIEASESKEWLVWSNEHNAFWRPDCSGYTRHYSSAGRYTIENAIRICANARSPIKDGERPNETMIHISSLGLDE